MAKKLHSNKSKRLQKWNYGWAGSYFITICTKNRVHYFGGIKNGAPDYSPVGAIADVLWQEIKHHAKHVELGAFIVMPNHVHGILTIKKNNDKIFEDVNPVQEGVTPGSQRFQNQGKNTVSSIIGSYKSAVTRHSRRLGFEFAWQTDYWEYIIRDERAFHNISNYIRQNPIKWERDKLNGGEGNVVLEEPAAYGEEEWMV